MIISETKKYEDDLIWHYTSVEALDYFLKNNATLYATHSSFLNDYKETEITAEILSLIGYNNLLFMGNMQEKFLNHISQTNKDGITWPRFLFCLTKNFDDLSQWRAYTPKGGFSIGFSQNELNDCLDISNARYIFSDCIYIDSCAENNLIAKISKMKNDINNIHTKLVQEGKTSKDEEYTKANEELSNNAVREAVISLLYKNKAFIIENEVRLAIVCQSINKDLEIVGQKPRIPVKLKASIDKLIKKIVVSPHGDYMQNKILAELLLEKYHKRIDVIFSGVSAKA